MAVENREHCSRDRGALSINPYDPNVQYSLADACRWPPDGKLLPAGD